MNRSQSLIIGVTVVATLVNSYGAVKKGNTVAIPVLGGFVASTILLGLSYGVPQVAEMFALAFGVTSLSVNGGDLFALLSDLTGQQPPKNSSGGGTPARIQ